MFSVDDMIVLDLRLGKYFNFYVINKHILNLLIIANWVC